jgi:DNA-binding MarR family transcriptional regulator
MEKSIEELNGYELWMALVLTNRRIAKVRAREVIQCGVSLKQYGILHFLANADHKPTAAEIARYYILEEHSVFVMLNKLIQLDFIKKTRDKERRNIWRISLTSKGLHAYQSASKLQSIDMIMSDLSHKEKRQYIACLDKLSKKAIEVMRMIG